LKIARTVVMVITSLSSGFSSADLQRGIDALNDEDYVRAAMEFTIDAKKGNSQAQVNLGLLYENGLGVEHSPDAAFSWYEAAAQKGSVLGQINLAALYYEGAGTDQSYKSAAHWYLQAAKRGNSTAQYNLSVMFENRQGLELDLVQAWAWRELAARNDTSISGIERKTLLEKLTRNEVLTARSLLDHYLIRYTNVD